MMQTPDGLVFDPGPHTYTFKGEKVPGVTTVLQLFSGLQFVDPRILEAAATFGKHVHEAVDLYNRGGLDEAWLEENSNLVWKHLQGWKRFLRESGAVVVASEQKVYHPVLKYAGTLDSICQVRDRNDLYDVKSTASVPKTVGPQTAAYEQAYRSVHGGRRMKRYCVHLKEDGYTCTPLQNPADWDIFKAALTLWRWRN